MVRFALMLVVTGVLASCAVDPSKVYVDQIVERFEVDECADVQLRMAGRNPDQSKPGGLLVFIADADCVDAMHRAFEIIDFRQIGESTYRYSSDQGWADVVTLTPLDDGSGTRIEWETVQ